MNRRFEMEVDRRLRQSQWQKVIMFLFVLTGAIGVAMIGLGGWIIYRVLTHFGIL